MPPRHDTNDALRKMGQRLRALRRERGLTLRAAAAAWKVHYATIANWEAGRVAPGQRTLARLANFFGVNVDWLRTGEGPMVPDVSAPTPWPAEKLQQIWRVDIAPPSDWPPSVVDYVAAALTFGLAPSAATLARMVVRARELGTSVALPPEIEAAVEPALHPGRGWRWPRLAEHLLRASDATLEEMEAAFRRRLDE